MRPLTGRDCGWGAVSVVGERYRWVCNLKPANGYWQLPRGKQSSGVLPVIELLSFIVTVDSGSL
jgi:hypothetical protein